MMMIVSLSSYSVFTAVQDLLVVDNLDMDIIMGNDWLEVCRIVLPWLKLLKVNYLAAVPSIN